MKTDRIPNGFILLGMILGMSGCLWAGQNPRGTISSILLAFLLLYPVYKIGALGAGDVKLLMMVGSFCGIKDFMTVLAGAFVAGAVFSWLKLLAEHNGRERVQYFLSYLSEVIRTGQWKLYGEDLQQDYRRYCSNKIHFAVPVLCSVVLKTGGIF
ncbi:MAG: A24 family peptidase [Clostridiales bacterium]|nr:A24 family peptidase [Clostridiales bacterium]